MFKHILLAKDGSICEYGEDLPEVRNWQWSV